MRIYPNLVLTLLLGSVCLSSARAQSVRGSGQVTRKEVPVEAFTKIRNSSSANLYLTDGGGPTLTIEADDNIIPLIEITSQNGELTIRNSDKSGFNTMNNIDVYLPLGALAELRNSGSGNISANKPIVSPALRLVHSGSGNITLALQTPTLVMTYSGSGNVTLTGQAQSFTLTLSGSGNVSTPQLLTETAQVNLSGTGNARVNCATALTVQLSGTGNVLYAGSPRLVSSVTGTGKVRQTSK